MMQLRRAGFFRELRHGDSDGPSLHEERGLFAEEDLDQILGYLDEGLLLVGCPGMGRDILNADGPPIDPPNLLTDGVWVWPGDLLHYLSVYAVSLPEEFVKHIRKRSYEVPRESEIDLQSLEY